MEYEYVQGFRRTSNLVWLPIEKLLYAKHDNRNGKAEFVCYQKVLQNNKNQNNKKKRKNNTENKENEEILKCTAKVLIDSDGRCVRNKIAHTCHDNHELIYKDMISKNKVCCL